MTPRYRVYIMDAGLSAPRRFAGHAVFMCEDVLVMDNDDAIAVMGMAHDNQVVFSVLLGNHEKYDDLEMDFALRVRVYDRLKGTLTTYLTPEPILGDEQAA